MNNFVTRQKIYGILLFVTASIINACASQEGQPLSLSVRHNQASGVQTATRDIVFLPNELSDIDAWQNIDQHLAGIVPYVSIEERPIDLIHEIIIIPSELDYTDAQRLPTVVARRQCHQLAQEWSVFNIDCNHQRTATYAVAALGHYEHDVARDMMAQELTMKHGLGSSFRRVIETDQNVDLEPARRLIVRMAAR